jgi:triosephosphate isomerase
MKIVIANWKMNGDVSFSQKIIQELNKVSTSNKVIVCPPAPLLNLFSDFRYELGAQNCFHAKSGAFTGEVSPVLLKELGCRYVILGHSERRAIFYESDELIFKKWNAVVECDLVPIVCVGEGLTERKNWKEIIHLQLKNYIHDVPILPSTIFAYEPVWSIGTGVIPEMEEIIEVIDFAKKTLSNPEKCHFVYGGSVNAKNYKQIMGCPNIDGALIGGASLNIGDFMDIVTNS